MIIKKISIIIPCYNEENTIRKVIEKVKQYKKYEIEIIIINDGSTDGSNKILDDIKDENIIILKHKINSGKGKAIQTGVRIASGDIVIIQDADLEYSPKDFDILLKPFEEADADVLELLDIYRLYFRSGRGIRKGHDQENLRKT